MKTSWVLGSMGLLLGACATTTAAPPPAPPAASASPPVAATAAPSASVAVAPPPVPAKRCAEVKDVETCKQGCADAEAGACLLLGELYAKSVPTESDGFVESDMVGAYGRACKQGQQAGCEKRDGSLAKLRDACKKSAKSCAVLGVVLDGSEEHAQELDVALERACLAGSVADACARRGSIHLELEPAKLHQPIAEKSFDRGCALGSAGSCCDLLNLYRATERERKADAAFKRLEAANAKAEGRLSCDYNPPLKPAAARATAPAR